MEKESINLSVPYTFARCYNAQCTQAEKCLRRLAAQHDANHYTSISIINPACIPTDGKGCEHFKTVEKIHVAWGVKRLLNKLPYEDSVAIRHQMIYHFGKSAYYRFYREERYLSPEKQALIRNLLRHRGITTEPEFDRYTDEYKW